jgi:pyruvate-formate lyase-activating enzyme
MSIVTTSQFETLEPAIDPNNRISFLLDWELTMKCNLDCSYCPTDLYGGHNNTTKHPPLAECVTAIDFMFRYVDLYMQNKPNGIKYVIMNVYGGESLHHPDIVEILKQVRQKHEHYKDHWHLTVTTTTNAIVSEKKLKQIIPYIDEFTVSYHTENSDKQKKQFKDNLLTIAQSGKRQKCVVLMHQEPELFEDANLMIEWLQQNNIKMLPRQLDYDAGAGGKRIYKPKQVKWFDKFYKTKTFRKTIELSDTEQGLHLSDVGRACCGGRQVCADKDYQHRHFFVENKFPNWYCSVNHFFLYVKQVNGEVFVNKDCKMNFDGQVGAIGNLNDSYKILQTLESHILNNNMPVIQCKKYKCMCGLCAPKAKSLDTYKSIMKKYQLGQNS